MMELQTEHPHIVQTEQAIPVVKGSRIAVWQIAVMFKAGDTPDDILEAYPHLSPPQVYDAISFYLDHQEVIEAQIAVNRIEHLLAEEGVTMDATGRVRFPEETA